MCTDNTIPMPIRPRWGAHAVMQWPLCNSINTFRLQDSSVLHLYQFATWQIHQMKLLPSTCHMKPWSLWAQIMSISLFNWAPNATRKQIDNHVAYRTHPDQWWWKFWIQNYFLPTSSIKWDSYMVSGHSQPKNIQLIVRSLQWGGNTNNRWRNHQTNANQRSHNRIIPSWAKSVDVECHISLGFATVPDRHGVSRSGS